MMGLLHIALHLLLAGIAAAHGNSDANPDSKFLEEENSLIDLVHQTPNTLLNYNWQIGGSVKFEEGRFILTPKPEITSSDDDAKFVLGSIWSQNPISFKTSTGFTFETTLRSVGATGKTGAGLSYWFIRDSDATATNYGGPSTFDGLQIVFTEDQISSFLNDGSIEAGALKPFSTCFLAYQDSDVPVTLRLSYSEKDSIKLTLNNYLCFETEKVKFDDLRNFKLGISASSPNDLTKFEQFELFKFETYNKVTDEASLEHKGALASQPKVVTKVVTSSVTKPTPQQLSFKEREQKLRESLKLSKNENGDDVIAKLEVVESANAEVLNKLDTLQTLFSNIDTRGSKSTSNSKLNNEFIIQSTKNHGELKTLLSANTDLLHEIAINNAATNEAINGLVTTLEQRILSLEDQLSRTHKLLDVVSSKIGTVTSDRHFNSIIAKLNEVDANQRNNMNQANKDNSIVSLQTKIKWIIILLFLIFIGIGYSVFKLRGEIKHGKIL